MRSEAQGILLRIPEQPAPAPLPPVVGVVAAAKPKLKPIDREQGLLRMVVVDELVPPDHKVRAIWDLTGELDLSRFYSEIQSQEGKAGSPAWDPPVAAERVALCVQRTGHLGAGGGTADGIRARTDVAIGFGRSELPPAVGG